MIAMGFLLVLSLADGLLTTYNCIEAENLCYAEPSCNTSYQILVNCQPSDNRLLHLGREARRECKHAEQVLHNNSMYKCKCQRGMKSEEHCLKVFWTVHSFLTHGYDDVLASPYDGSTSVHSGTAEYNRLAALVSDMSYSDSESNRCLHAAQVCSVDERCLSFRTEYVATCTKRSANNEICNRRKCHKNLRRFFDSVPKQFSQRLLFCFCQDVTCGERRRQTIVPKCSFEEEEKPSCLNLLDSCRKDNICRSRLADFHKNCQYSPKSVNGCLEENRAACLMSYTGLIGTAMTPNYVSNCSLELSLWCTCEGSGNFPEECEKILNLFTNNICLKNAIEDYTNWNQFTQKKDAQQRAQLDDVQEFKAADMNQRQWTTMM
nr:PREDICTED: GDNF family receptor alpha-3 isoform X2 [Latimeria chalumnae]|eukprot:XP_005992449.1 PREDICTED: GDNF family receptor alpha-3 isoform X2 [Latimeria chalumnae]